MAKKKPLKVKVEKVIIREPVEPVCWLLNYPRPTGLEPTIYLRKPKVESEFESVNPDPDALPHYDPMAPQIIACYSFQDALSRILHFNIKLALTEFKIER